MLRIFEWIRSFVKLSFYAHHSQFDLIRPVNGYSIEQVRKCYLISLALFTVNILYGIFGLECESRPSCQIDWASLPLSPYNFFHQMFPKSIWWEVNFMALSIWILCIGGWIVFLVNPPIERRYLIFVDEVTEEKKDELTQMCTFRRIFVKFSFVFEISIILYGWVFVYVHVFGINANYNLSFTSFLFWGLLNPIHICYIGVFIFAMPFYVILTSRYMTIQQKTLESKLVDLNLKLSKIRGSNLTWRRATLQHIWSKYLSVNMQICDLCLHMQEYARFWSPFLTMLFMTFISVQCYIFYMYLFVSGLPLALRFVLLLAALAVVFNEFVLISQCAKVVKHFKRITKLNRTFYECYRSTPGVGKVLGRNLAKAETLQDSRLLHSYAFRLFGNYRITTKSFHMIISYINIFFLYIVKDKQ